MAGVSASVGLSRRALLALAAGGVAPRGGRAAALSPVRIAAATAIPHAYNGYMIAGAATGLYARVGLQPEFLWIAGSAAALQLILSGDADIANVSFLDFIAAKQKQPRLPARMVYCQDYTSSYVLVVPEASPIRSLADFKGKSVGVVSLASGTVRSAQATLRQAGYDPADTEIVAVGPDAAALAALRSGRVDALDAFIGSVAIMENAGMRFRQFTAPFPADGFAVSEQTLAKNRDLLVRGFQGITLSTALSQIDPRAASRAFYALYGAPSGDFEVALGKDVHTIERTMEFFKKVDDGRKWGELTADDWKRLVAFAGPDSGVTEENTPLESVFDGSLIDEVNRVDIGWARAAAGPAGETTK